MGCREYGHQSWGGPAAPTPTNPDWEAWGVLWAFSGSSARPRSLSSVLCPLYQEQDLPRCLEGCRQTSPSAHVIGNSTPSHKSHKNQKLHILPAQTLPIISTEMLFSLFHPLGLLVTDIKCHFRQEAFPDYLSHLNYSSATCSNLPVVLLSTTSWLL